MKENASRIARIVSNRRHALSCGPGLSCGIGDPAAYLLSNDDVVTLIQLFLTACSDISDPDFVQVFNGYQDFANRWVVGASTPDEQTAVGTIAAQLNIEYNDIGRITQSERARMDRLNDLAALGAAAGTIVGALLALTLGWPIFVAMLGGMVIGGLVTYLYGATNPDLQVGEFGQALASGFTAGTMFGGAIDVGLQAWVAPNLLRAPTTPALGLEGMAISGIHYLVKNPNGPYTIVYYGSGDASQQPGKNAVEADTTDGGAYNGFLVPSIGKGTRSGFDPCNLLTHPGHVYGGPC